MQRGAHLARCFEARTRIQPLAARAITDEELTMATQRDTRSDMSPRKMADRLKEEGKSRLERGKSSAAEQVEHVASALKSAGSELGGQSTLGTYANQLADSIERFGSRLREGSIEDLARDLQAAAQRNPMMFVAGGLALGVVFARLVRASTPEPSNVYEGDYDELSTQAASAAGNASAYTTSATPQSRSDEPPTLEVSGPDTARPGPIGG